MENKTTLTGPRIYQKGEGAGKFIKSHYLGYFPESKLMYAMLIAALGGMMFLVMEESLMGSAMSGGLADSLNASPNTMSWVLSSVSLGTICGFPLAGPIADKIGRRALVLLGLLGYVICDIFQMLCLNIPSFLIARFCSGMVGMFTIAPTLAMVRDYTPRVNRGMGYGLSLALGWGGGGLLTFFMGGTILSTFAGRTLFGMEGDWRWIFYIAGILALVIFVIELLVLKDIHPMLRLRHLRPHFRLVHRQVPRQEVHEFPLDVDRRYLYAAAWGFLPQRRREHDPYLHRALLPGCRFIIADTVIQHGTLR